MRCGFDDAGFGVRDGIGSRSRLTHTSAPRSRSNPGGVYILAICSIDALTTMSPKDCKFHAFKAPSSAAHDAGLDAPHDAPPDVVVDHCPPPVY